MGAVEVGKTRDTDLTEVVYEVDAANAEVLVVIQPLRAPSMLAETTARPR